MNSGPYVKRWGHDLTLRQANSRGEDSKFAVLIVCHVLSKRSVLSFMRLTGQGYSFVFLLSSVQGYLVLRVSIFRDSLVEQVDLKNERN